MTMRDSENNMLPSDLLLQSQGEGRAAAAIENDSVDQQQQLQLQQQQQQRPLVDQSGETSRNNNLKANNGAGGIPRDVWRNEMAADPSRFKSGIPTAFDPNHSRDSMNVTRGSSGIPTPGSAQPSGPPLRLVDYLRNDPTAAAHPSVPRPVSASRNNIS